MRLAAELLVSLIILTALRSPSNLVAAQSSTSGSLTGVVTDPSDAVVPGANVLLKDKEKEKSKNKIANGGGEFPFSFGPPENYILTVTHPASKTIRKVRDATRVPPPP